ncbi:iron-containing alcohol dehydrogenase [Aquirufa ecclesiirivi]|uniref:Iron-containing alcohol dehydrogenase n=1 Tax=Aquirufa ecclesiirivi TaxID=2715124 RepID=A0ABT4JID9_9BACT|nr:iron-containing alcohol dehydrogenase [Aquirufa ecclesiirivi]MCZ2472761.1 iron-containing alcohol dehydrogenase [Aquirufa ecclesiirivi]MCZ2475331.1 iron-containing alcohol dehydrogenase [Aquirufa ecclesiirivi]MDF0694133.1 iron-containing alcohol dehydrogenase [Aquirufa ecclesiirivi]
MSSSILQYNFPTTIRFGAGAINEVADYLIKNDLKKPLVVTDPVVASLDFFKSFIQSLEKKNISVEVFSQIHKNPVKSDVYLGVDSYDANQRDSIIGIGGGAAMDVARAMVLRVNHREDLFKYDDLIGGDIYVTNDVPHFITIPTTAGTGSEVGRSAIIADDVTHQKKILFSPKLLAKTIFADPMLTMDLPPAVTAATGMDALTHNLEAYVAKMSHPLCEGIALEGISLIAKSMEKAVKNPDIESKSNMLIASLMGAVAFQKGLGVVHSLAHPMSSLLDTHHGLANAVNLPYGMKFNIAGFEEKFRRIARTLEIKDESGEGVVNFLFDLNNRIGIPHQLREVGVKEEHIETLADLAIADFAHPNNPKPVSREDFKNLYLEAL